MLRSKKLQIRKKYVKTVRAVGWKPNRVSWIEPNPSKDRVISVGDNPSFLRWICKIYFFLDSAIHIRILNENNIDDDNVFFIVYLTIQRHDEAAMHKKKIISYC
jgi:hypothetical protein